MTDYRNYINALRKCAKEHENDTTYTGHIRVSDLCRDTANLLETLEQKPTTKNNLGVDCISRDEVCQYVADFVNHEFSTREEEELIDNIITGIERIPSVTPQEPRWISVSERLPENKETVLVTFKHFVSGNTIGLGSVILLRDKPHWHVREQNLDTYDVLAWMPLPKPFEPQESEEI